MDKRSVAVSLGLEAEKVFELECFRRDIPLFKSVGICQVDYISCCDGKLSRIQIKSTDSDKEDNLAIRCSWGHHGTGWKPYTKKETDIIATYIRRKNEWYIIPVEEVDSILGFSIATKGRLYKYLSRWDLLTSTSITKIEEKETEKEKAEKIINLHKEDKTNYEIEIATGYNRSYIAKILRLSGFSQQDRLSVATYETLNNLYTIEKLTQEQISKKLNLSIWFIRKKFREFNIETCRTINLTKEIANEP